MLCGTTTLMVSRVAPISSSQATQPVFSAPINLSNDLVNGTGNASNPDIASVGSHVYVAWSELNKGILFRESPNGGSTWYPPLNESGQDIAPAGRTTAPLISANGSNVYIAWSQTIGVTGAQIVETTSTNYGVTFSTPVELTNSATGAGPFITPFIASYNDTVAVVFNDAGDNESFATVSSNAGTTWTTPYAYAHNREDQVAVYQSDIYVVADPITIAVSNNAGVNWSKSFTVGPYGSEAWVAAAGSNAYVAWETKGSTSQAWLTMTHNDGANFTAPTLLTGSVSDAWAPMVSALGNSVWIAVHNFPGGNMSRVYVYTSTTNGTSWNLPVEVSGAVGSITDTSFPFTVSTSDGINVFTAWSEQVDPNTWQLMVSYSADGGTAWTPSPGIDASQNPTGTQGSNSNDLADAAIASSGASVFATWQQFNTSNPNVNQVYFSAYNAPIPTTTTSSTTGSSSNSTSTSSTGTGTTGTGSTGTSHSTASGTTQSSTGSGFSLNSTDLLYAGVAAVIVAAVILTVVFIRRPKKAT
jgi:hypothetical protein